MPEVIISIRDTKLQLRKLKDKTAVGPDGINNCLLKGLSESLCVPLTILFNKSLTSSTLPSDWLTADVIPLFKGKGDKSSPENYRPISLTSVVCKVLESLLKKHILRFLSLHELLDTRQFGFLQRKSTTSQLLSCMEEWSSALGDQDYIDVVYLDFAKAFDTVPHAKLLYKMNMYGLTGMILEWIKAYLAQRTQRVNVNGTLSSWKDVTSGVPQGSVLGPLLFLIYINDLPKAISTACCVLFADDTKIYRVVKTHSDSLLLQTALNDLSTWVKKWDLRLNTNKCAVLHLGRKNACHGYVLDGARLAASDCERDLGVFVDKELKFSKHIDRLNVNARRLMGQMYKVFKNRDIQFHLMLFKSYIRPILEYASPVWNPYLMKDRLKLEKIQRSFTKKLPGLSHLSYSERLQHLHLQLLEERRVKIDLAQVYKIVNGLDDLDYSDFFVDSPAGITRGHSLKLFYVKCRRTGRLNSFTMRCVRRWNALPERAVQAR